MDLIKKSTICMVDVMFVFLFGLMMREKTR